MRLLQITASSLALLHFLCSSLQCTAFAPILPRTVVNSRTSTFLPDSSSSTALYGIPKMFRWLTDQYPNINRRLHEGLGDLTSVENFYLDMNGIIHPCTHGNAEGEIIVLDETAMFKKIFLYVDRYV